MLDWLAGLFASRDSRRDTDGVYAGAIEIPGEGDRPEWIRLLQTGEYLNHPDGAHEVTREDLEQMVENFERVETDLLVDKDHDSVFMGDTRAAGWIVEVELREDGLYGRWPDWTPWGEELVGSREYRYLSPVYSLTSEAKDGTPQGARLHSVSLTNIPYMDTGEVDAISSPARDDDSSDPDDTDPDPIMDRDELIDLLGLDEDATDEEIEAALDDLKDAKEALEDAEPEGGPEGEPDGDDDPEADGDEPDEEDDLEAKVNSLQKELRELRQEQEQDRAERLVNSAIDDGKIAPANKEVWLNSARSDYEGTKEKLDAKDDGAALPGGVDTPSTNDDTGGDDLIANTAQQISRERQ